MGERANVFSLRQMITMLVVIALSSVASSANANSPRTPIKHLIVIVGENRSFDHLFGAYRPCDGQSVMNLLSQQTINPDGTPGANFAKAQQWQAQDKDHYSIAPTRT